MSITRRGIYHDLQDSTYTASNVEVVFFFSSKLYRDKFMDEHVKYRKDHMDIIKKIAPDYYNYYKERLFFYYDIRCYAEIEKRGFRIVVKGVDYRWQKEIQKYALAETINTNTDDWCVTQGQK